MADSPSSRTLIIGLSVALAAALVVIAFLLGRESARAPALAEAEVPAPPALEPEIDARVGETEARRWPEWADLDEWEGFDETAPVEPTTEVERIERRPNGTVLLSNRSASDPAPNAAATPSSNDRASAVSDYFLQMDVIHSESGAGDPNTFAMGLIKAGLGGSTAGFDQLLADTQRMEGEIRRLTPPPSCASYHEANLDALARSREILEEMKTAFARSDFSSLTTIARRAGALQHEAKALQEMRERIIADAQR